MSTAEKRKVLVVCLEVPSKDVLATLAKRAGFEVEHLTPDKIRGLEADTFVVDELEAHRAADRPKQYGPQKKSKKGKTRRW